MYGGIGLRDAMSQEFIYTFKTNTDKTLSLQRIKLIFISTSMRT